jgi:hypothetical protein
LRHLTTLALAGLFVGLLLTSDASACHKRKCCCPTPVCVPPPPPPPPVCEPVCAPQKCHFRLPRLNFGCHKKAVCAPVVYTCPTPVYYAAPVYAAPQATGQGS